jgi:hypothetical protein
VGQGLDRAQGQAEHAGDLGLGEVLVEAEDQDARWRGRRSWTACHSTKACSSPGGGTTSARALARNRASTPARRSSERRRLTKTLRA